jgi:iron complex outermembrane receptor protein
MRGSFAVAVTLAATGTACGAEVPLSAVVVTATRQPGDAFNAPAAIDAVDGDVMRDGQLQVNLSETLARVPGIFVQNRQNLAQELQISSRGFGARASFGVRGIKVLVDGIPTGGPDGQAQVASFAIGLAQRLEVLRGPYSALYGNASGGVIQLITAPAPQTWQSQAGLALASAGTARLGAGIGGPLSPNVGGVVDISHFETEGTRPQSAARRDLVSGRLDIAAGSVSVMVSGHLLDIPEAGDALGLTRAQLNANPDQTASVAGQFNTRKSTRQRQLGSVVDWIASPDIQVRAMLYAGQRDVTQFQAIPVTTQAPATHPGGVIDFARDFGGADLRITNSVTFSGSTLRLQAGAAIDSQREDRRGFQNFLGVTGALRRDETNRSRSNDVYAQADWELPRLALFAGLRGTRVNFESADHYVVPGNPDDSGARRFSATTPVAGATWKMTEQSRLFASAGRGVETPTANELAYRADAQSGLNLGLAAARSRNAELGWRLQSGQTLHASLVAFRADTRDEITVLSNSGGRATFQNAGRTHRRGLEGSLDWRPNPVFATHVAFTTLNARYGDSFRTCNASPCMTPNVAIPAGNRLPGAPQRLAYAELVAQPRPEVSAALEWRHQGRIFVDDLNTDAASSANVLAARLAWSGHAVGWQWTASLRGDNLTNQRGAQTVIVNEANGRFFEPRPGRSWLFTLQFRPR